MIYKKLYFFFALFLSIGSLGLADARACGHLFESPAVRKINDRLADPEYKVIILGRHGKASEINKFPAKEREADKIKRGLDIERPLKKKGVRAAKRLAEMLGPLDFRDVWMWGSFAHRVIETASYTINALGDKVKHKSFEEDLYYTDVPKEMHARLTANESADIAHAFFWGHGKTTLELFKKLTGATETFLPTSGVMVVAVKAKTWEEVFNGNPEHIEGFAWSPNDTHVAAGTDVPILNLETIPSNDSVLESTPVRESVEESDPLFEPTVDSNAMSESILEPPGALESMGGLESLAPPSSEGFVELVIRR